MYQSILVPFDNSDHAKNALEHALMIANTCDAKVTVLYVADMPDFSDPSFAVAARLAGVAPMTEGETQTLQNQFYATQKEALIEDAADIVGDFENIEYCATAGKPNATIVQFAESENYDIIIMGCRGLSALRGALGSVSGAVVRSVSIPVLLVK